MVRAIRQWRCPVEEVAAIINHLLPADRIIGPCLLCAFLLRDHVIAIKRVVKAPPASVYRVKRKSSVHYWYDQLRARLLSNLGVDIFGAYGKLATLGN